MKTLKIVVVLAMAVAAHFQTSRGTVTGTVLDRSGSAVPGAQASLIAIRTGVKLSAASNDSGSIVSTLSISVPTNSR